MDFSLGEDRQMLADMLLRFLQSQYDFASRETIAASPQGMSVEVWQKLADLGVIGALFDPSCGGFGGNGFDVGVVFGEIGRALVVEPLLASMCAGRVLARSRPDLVEQIIFGSKLIAFAHEEPGARVSLDAIETVAEKISDRWTLSGKKSVVACAGQAHSYVVTARTIGAGPDKLAAFLVPRDAPGLGVSSYALVDGGQAGDLVFENTPAELIDTLDQEASIEDAFATAIVALCWEAVAIMDVIKQQTLAYLKMRTQFGVAIGSFQAVQHRMVNVALEIEQARSAAINAAALLGNPGIMRKRAIAGAKLTIGRVGSLVAEEAIQLHGAIGMTWELPLSHYAKRLIMIGHQYGDEDYHLAQYIELANILELPSN